MIRVWLIVLAIAALVVLVIALQGDPGVISTTWGPWEVSATAAAGILLALGAMFLTALITRLGDALGEAGRRGVRLRADRQRRDADAALALGFAALAAGETDEARRQAEAADAFVPNQVLAPLLAAQSAAAAGDRAGARELYEALLETPGGAVAARRGLAGLAAAEGGASAALVHARAAWDHDDGAAWAWRALLDDRLAAADWTAAEDLVRRGERSRLIDKVSAERARGVLRGLRTSGASTDEARRQVQAALGHSVEPALPPPVPPPLPEAAPPPPALGNLLPPG